MSLPNLQLNNQLLKYSASVATFTALSYHVYQEYQKKAISGKSWDEIAREKRRTAAAKFCSYIAIFHSSLREAREFLRTGQVEEALRILVRCLHGWEFKKQTLRALKRHLHPEFFVQLVNKLVQEESYDCKDVLGHLSAPVARHYEVGLNMSLK